MSETGADYFLKIDGIEGESGDSKHKTELQLLSFSRGALSPTDTATGSKTGRAVLDDLQCTMRVDKAYTLLLGAAVNNQLLTSAVLTCRKAGKEQYEYLKITLTSVMLSKVALRASPDDDPVPIVEFSMNFAKISEEYKSQTALGSMSGTLSYTYSVQDVT